VSATALDKTAVTDLGSAFQGELIGREHPAYHEHRKIWNGSIDRRPLLIARCADAADVAAAINLAHRTGLQTAVRSGGHSFPGMGICEDGLVIDTSLMKSIEIDDEGRTVRAGAGTLLGELDEATQAIGMAVPAGIVTHTGLAGLTLGGGIGWLQRKYGLTIDQLVSVQLVTAAGEQLTVSEDENADLFWGIRGGGGNFGVVTEFEYRLNPLGPVVHAGAIAWDIEDSPEMLRFYRDWITDVPDELTTIVVHRRAPVSPVIPEELHGKHMVLIGGCFAGDPDEARAVFAPLRAFKEPLVDFCVDKPFVEHQAMFDPTFPHGRWYYFQSHDVAELSDELIDTVVDQCRRIKSPHSGSPIFQLGGAVANVADDATAYNGRAAGHTININGVAETSADFEEERDWVRGMKAALEPYGTGVYVNFMMDEGEERVRKAYGPEKFARLQAIKAKYDPDNFFRLNQNIPPASG
jgi:FAD/FMN-containing dehydrogenase